MKGENVIARLSSMKQGSDECEGWEIIDKNLFFLETTRSAESEVGVAGKKRWACTVWLEGLEHEGQGDTNERKKHIEIEKKSVIVVGKREDETWEDEAMK